MDLPKRKQIRLPDYDYSSPGAYFVTICTRDRRCILSEITVGAAIMSRERWYTEVKAHGIQVSQS